LRVRWGSSIASLSNVFPVLSAFLSRVGMRKAILASLALIAVQFLAGLYLYPVMPERMAIHWGLSGGADGYGSRLLGLFLVPSISALFFPFFLALPRLDPSRGINGFKGSYDWFVFGFLAYMAYVNALMLAWNPGWRFGFMRALAPAVGAMLYGIGALMERSRLNWLVGIRTPWTLSSEEVWDRTHEVGARLFKACGVLALAGVLLDGLPALLLAVAPIMVASVYLLNFSYSGYQRRTLGQSL